MYLAPSMCKDSPSTEERAVFAHECASEHTGDGLIHADSVQTSSPLKNNNFFEPKKASRARAQSLLSEEMARCY